MNMWQQYVAAVAGGATQTAIGERTGIAQSTIGRWLNGGYVPTEAAKVAAFAQAYERNPLEAFVAAGMLTQDEAGRGLDESSVILLRSLAPASTESPAARNPRAEDPPVRLVVAKGTAAVKSERVPEPRGR